MLVTISSDPTDRDHCARLAAAIDPWRRLQIAEGALRRVLDQPDCELWVAREAEAEPEPEPEPETDPRAPRPPCGFLLMNYAGAFTPYVNLLAVDPAHAGRGIGRALLVAAERAAFARRPNVFICVSSFNEAAQRFYAALGYERVGELKDYLVRGADEWLLRKTRGPLLGR